MDEQNQSEKPTIEKEMPKRHMGMMQKVVNTFFYAPHKPLGRQRKVGRRQTMGRRKTR